MSIETNIFYAVGSLTIHFSGIDSLSSHHFGTQIIRAFSLSLPRSLFPFIIIYLKCFFLFQFSASYLTQTNRNKYVNRADIRTIEQKQ